MVFRATYAFAKASARACAFVLSCELYAIDMIVEPGATVTESPDRTPPTPCCTPSSTASEQIWPGV